MAASGCHGNHIPCPTAILFQSHYVGKVTLKHHCHNIQCICKEYAMLLYGVQKVHKAQEFFSRMFVLAVDTRREKM